jgi:SAM-dependent methyltransferase
VPENPWLTIPAQDYEGHMDSPAVDQLAPLKKIFAGALKKFQPRTVAILGCATGNGIDAVDFEKIYKLYALDINPDFLEIMKKRYSRNLSQIETIACDLDRDQPGLSNIDLVFAALIFEYVDAQIVMEKIAKWLAPNGVVVVVLQCPCKDISEITPSSFKSLEKLAPIMKLVDSKQLISIAKTNRMTLLQQKIHKLKSGKQFCSYFFSTGPIGKTTRPYISLST